MKQNTQPIAEPDSEKFFPGEEPFSRKKRERQRQIALYLTLTVCTVLLGIGLTLRYTLLAGAYKGAPYQPPSVASNTTEEEPEKREENSKLDTISPALARSSNIPTDLHSSYFSDAPDSGNGDTTSPTPTPAPTPSSLVPDAVPASRIGTEDSVTVGEVVTPIEITPLSRDVTPPIRLFELPSPPPADPSKLTTATRGLPKIGAPKAPQDSDRLRPNITTPTITTLPGSLPQPGTTSGQTPSSPITAEQPGVPAPSPGSPTDTHSTP